MLKEKKNLWLIFAAITLLICVIVVIVISNGKDKSTKNTENKDLYKEEVVDNFSFTIKEMSYDKPFTDVILEVKNISNQDLSLGGVNLIFKNAAGEEVASLISYSDEVISPSKTITLNVSIDRDIRSSTTVAYSLIEVPYDE